MREYVISDKQLATIVLKFGGKMMNYSDGTDFVDYDEVDKYEPVEIHELIRCRDCKHYDRMNDDEGMCMVPDDNGDYARWMVDEDGFCYLGMRWVSK